MIIAVWIAVSVALLLSSYAALSVLLAQIAGGRWMRNRRPLPQARDLRRSAAARKGHATRKRNVEAMRTAQIPQEDV